MTSNLPVAQVDEHDFEAIEAAVMETARGRWFLGEYARRMRAAETAKVLEAITRLERSFATDKTKMTAGGMLTAGELTEAVVIIERRLSEIAWSLRERGFDGRTCAEIDNQARALRQLTGAAPAPAVAAAPMAPAIAPVAAAPAVAPLASVPQPVVERPPARPQPVIAPPPPVRPPVAAVSRTMSSIAMLNARLAEIRENGTLERAGASDATSFVGRALRSLADIDAMDDRARARLFS